MHQCETEFPCKVETLLTAWDDLSRGEAASCCDCSVCTWGLFACFCCAALAQTDCVVCHSCHIHVDARRECTSNIAGAGTGSADFDSLRVPSNRCLANILKGQPHFQIMCQTQNVKKWLLSNLKTCENMRIQKIWGRPPLTYSNGKLQTLLFATSFVY